MATDTKDQAGDGVTAEMIERAAAAFEENRMGKPMTAALVASGLPAEVARLRLRWQETSLELADERARRMDHDAELSRLRGELAEAEQRKLQAVSEIMRDVCECEPDDAEHPETICILRGTLLMILHRNLGIDPASLKDQQP